MERWYVIESQPNSERKARDNLKEQGFTFFLPVFHKISRHARRIKTVEAPYFPRYLFVRFDAHDRRWCTPVLNARGKPTRWSAIKSTRGVLRILTDVNDVPIPIETAFITSLQQRAAKHGGVIKLTEDEKLRFRKGDQVRVNDGPFTSFFAIVRRMNGTRVKVDVNLFGRSTPVDLDESQLEAA